MSSGSVFRNLTRSPAMRIAFAACAFSLSGTLVLAQAQPAPADAPSDLGIIGRYVLTPNG